MTEQERVNVQNTLYFLGRAYRSSQENLMMEACQRWLEAMLNTTQPAVKDGPKDTSTD